MRSVIYVASLSLAALLTAPALAAPGEPIGQAIAIKNNVTAAYANDRRPLAKDDPVRQEEIIEVGLDSLGELKFKDDTKLALGPGSRMTLDKFVYDPDKTNGSIVVNLLKGTFRFITGLAAKPAYQIKTPSASISVRGTIFDVYIKPDGTTWLLLIDGAIEVCNDAGTCRVLDEPGKFIRVSEDHRKANRSGGPGGWNVGTPVKWAALPGHTQTPIETAFPFVPAAPSFDPDPWYTSRDIIIGRFPRHPHHPNLPPRGDGGKGDGSKGGGGNAPYPGNNGGTKPPSDGKPPVILKGDHPIKHRLVHARNDDPPKKPKVDRPKADKPVKIIRHRDHDDPPAVKHKPRAERIHDDKPPRRSAIDRASKTAVLKQPTRIKLGIGTFGGGGSPFNGGGFGHGRR